MVFSRRALHDGHRAAVEGKDIVGSLTGGDSVQRTAVNIDDVVPVASVDDAAGDAALFGSCHIVVAVGAGEVEGSGEAVEDVELHEQVRCGGFHAHRGGGKEVDLPHAVPQGDGRAVHKAEALQVNGVGAE